jgi:hypothetical protein
VWAIDRDMVRHGGALSAHAAVRTKTSTKKRNGAAHFLSVVILDNWSVFNVSSYYSISKLLSLLTFYL